MANSNCLEGLSCPECGQEDRLNIAVTAWASVTDEGTEDFRSVEWDEESACGCPECGFSGKVSDFRRPEAELGVSGP